jgi:hypothetical protein
MSFAAPGRERGPSVCSCSSKQGTKMNAMTEVYLDVLGMAGSALCAAEKVEGLACRVVYLKTGSSSGMGKIRTSNSDPNFDSDSEE